MYIKKIFMILFFLLTVGIFTASDNFQVEAVDDSFSSEEYYDVQEEDESSVETDDDVIIIKADVSDMARKLKSYNKNTEKVNVTSTKIKSGETKEFKNKYNSVVASFYGEYFHGRTTANGEIYDMYALTAAHKTLPLGTIAKVTNLENNKSVVVRINDRGPYIDGREIDLSQGSFAQIGDIGKGLLNVNIEIIKFGDNKYVKNSK